MNSALELDQYLAKHYWNERQLCVNAMISTSELNDMMDARLIPTPSYVVSENGTMKSAAFGEMIIWGANPGRYFHPSQVVWINLARKNLQNISYANGEVVLKISFVTKFAAALATLNLTTLRLHDSFEDNGLPIESGLKCRTDAAWEYFLNGTFALCVANPISEAHIAFKEVLQEKLTLQSENGNKTDFSRDQALAVLHLIEQYEAASMPFSPPEYPKSSRKRLVDDLRTNLKIVVS